jgi:hypothetical protein
MSIVAIQRENENQPLSPTRYAARDWAPFRAMRDFFRCEPFAELAPGLAGFESAIAVTDT